MSKRIKMGLGLMGIGFFLVLGAILGFPNVLWAQGMALVGVVLLISGQLMAVPALAQRMKSKQ